MTRSTIGSTGVAVQPREPRARRANDADTAVTHSTISTGVTDIKGVDNYCDASWFS